MTPPGLAVLASGRGTNFEAIARAVAEGRIPARLVLVVSDRPDAEVLRRAERLGVPSAVLRPRDFPDRDAHDRALVALLRKAGADYVAHAGYMRVLGPAYLAAYEGRALNVHPSLLPAFPGLDAPARALRAGARVTGCTVHLVDAGVDTGPVVAQEVVVVRPDDTPATLHARIQEVEHRIFPEALARLVRGEFEGLAGELAARRDPGPLALFTTADKSGLVPFARALSGLGWRIAATGGTAKALRDAGLAVVPVESLTGLPEAPGGRVKTLHPAIHGGILARRDRAEDLAWLRRLSAQPIDLVVVNLYPFVATVRREPPPSLEEALEEIDVGGPSLLRAAAKNWPHVTVVSDPADYDEVLAHLAAGPRAVPAALRLRLAAKAFRHTATYDAAIARYLEGRRAEPEDDPPSPRFPREWPLPLVLRRVLRYGENPHQAAALYADPLAPPGLAQAEPLQGKPLSYNNLLDAEAAWRAASSFEEPAAAAVKHLSPCGLATGSTALLAFRAALRADPVSIFGGIVAFNRPVDGEVAAELARVFLEVVVAPAFEPAAREILARRPNLRLLELPCPPPGRAFSFRSVAGGMLLQEEDAFAEPDRPESWKVVTRRAPTPAELRAAAFAWRAVRFVRSNAIVVAFADRTIGIGGGQTNRIDAVREALARARAYASREGLPDLAGAALASDAFFPFPDAVEAAREAGIRAIVQPGGSVRDDEVIQAADEAGLAMCFTARRHFLH